MWNWIEGSNQKLVRIIKIIEDWRKEKPVKRIERKVIVLKKVS